MFLGSFPAAAQVQLKHALALSSTLENGLNSPEAQAAENQGFVVTIVDGTAWDAMQTTDFSTYDLIILGDPNCVSTDPGPIAPAAANASVWGAAINGNVVLLLTDPDFHSHSLTAPLTLINNAIGFAGSKPGTTGLYVSLSCYYAFTAVNTPVAALAGLGTFTVEGQGACPENAHIVDTTNPVVAGLTDAVLSNWSCSAHGGFDTWPTNRFSPVVITPDIASSFTAPDGTRGAPYILVGGGNFCSAPTLAPPTDFSFIGNEWSGDVSISSNDGLVLRNVALGPRYMANQISIPYFNLATNALVQVRGELKSDSNDAIARSRLVDFQFTTGAFTSIQATYAIDNLPAGSGNCLAITQLYEFHDEENGCEPTGQLRCSRWFPKITYTYSGDDALQSLTIPERLYFRDENTSNDQVKLFQDSDAPVRFNPPNPIPQVSPIEATLLVDNESPQGQTQPIPIILKGTRNSIWDNYHQSFKDITEPTAFSFNFNDSPALGPHPGCPECVHIHWRWGGATNVTVPFKVFDDFFAKNGSGNPIIPAGSNQDVNIAVVAFHPGEEHPFDYTDLLNGESLKRQSPVLWYVGTGHQAKDTFFMHGGFFQPKQEADLSVSVTAPNSIQDGQNLTYNISIFNLGPSWATKPILRQVISLPNSFLVGSNQGCPGFDPLSGLMLCQLHDIPPFTTLNVTVTVQVFSEFAPGSTTLDPLVSVFTVNSNQSDPTQNDNRTKTITQVTQ
jgi:hypothetical protein